MVLGREDVARGPADLGPERLERLDQDGRLDGHVERAGDARALEGLPRGVLLADGHEAGHLGFGDGDLAAAPARERDVGDVVVGKSGGLLCNGGHVQSLLTNERAPLHGSNSTPASLASTPTRPVAAPLEGVGCWLIGSRQGLAGWSPNRPYS